MALQPVIRHVTQFDPPGTHAIEAAIPGGCCCGACCCCCCCCLATTISVSAVAAIQTSRKAREAPVKPRYAGVWVALAGFGLVIAAILIGGAAYAISESALSSSNPPLTAYVLGFLAVWGALLWAAFRGVGFANPVARSLLFIVIGAIAFPIEFAFGLNLIFWTGFAALPAYVLGAIAVIVFVIWRALPPIANFTDRNNPPRP